MKCLARDCDNEATKGSNYCAAHRLHPPGVYYNITSIGSVIGGPASPADPGDAGCPDATPDGERGKK